MKAAALWIALWVGPATSFATENISRIAITGGSGQAVSDSADGLSSYTEAPMALGAFVDHAWKESYFLFVEHMRSFGDGASSMGLTGGGAKYYPWLNPLHAHSPIQGQPAGSSISIHGYSTYFGGSVGMAQSSVPAIGRIPATVAVGFYLAGKAGVETVLTGNWGIFGEANIAVTVAGSGSVQYFNLVGGFSYAL